MTVEEPAAWGIGSCTNGVCLHERRIPTRIHWSSSSRSTGPASEQQPCCDEFLTSPHAAREPGPGDGSGDLGADVVASLSHVAEMIDQGLEFGAFRGEQRFTVKFRRTRFRLLVDMPRYRTTVRHVSCLCGRTLGLSLATVFDRERPTESDEQLARDIVRTSLAWQSRGSKTERPPHKLTR